MPEARARSRVCVCVCVRCVRAVRASDLGKGTRNAAQHSAAQPQEGGDRSVATGRQVVLASARAALSGRAESQMGNECEGEAELEL